MTQAHNSNTSGWLIPSIVAIVLIGGALWYFNKEEQVSVSDETEISNTPVIQEKVEPSSVEQEVIEPIDLPEIDEEPNVEVPVESEPPVNPLPALDQSDAFVLEKLPNITWRKELLKLVVDKDMIRRLVVFTDNFAQGIVAYNNSPLVSPATSFSVKGNSDVENEYQWDEQSSKRFTQYVDLLRSMESDSLVALYFELKPLVDEAYAELGYPDDDFTEVLLDAITRVLDMELPKDNLDLVRPSVMYKYKNPNVESLDDTDKLLLRIGKDNLLILKSVLLEFSEKLSRADD